MSFIQLPPDVLDLLRRAGVTTEQYVRWVAGHEGSHAVLAIHLHATLEQISLCPIGTGTSFSLARAIWQCGSARNEQVPWIIAAGPAYDDIHYPQLAPSSLRTDYETAVQYLRGKLPAITAERIDGLWNAAVEQAAALLRQPDIARAVDLVQKLIQEGLNDERPSISASEVHAALE